MADWYVSTQGLDANSGSAAAPWLTVQKGLDGPNSGLGLGPNDTLWIAPGLYEVNSLDIDVLNSPTVNNEAKIRGDPNLTQSWGTSETPGQVVLSRSASLTPGSGYAFAFNNKNHVHVYDIQFLGGNGTANTTGGAVNGDGTADNQRCIRCTAVASYSGFYRLIVDRCAAITGGYSYLQCANGGDAGSYNGYVTNSVASGLFGAWQCNCDQVFYIGAGAKGAHEGYQKNCTNVGALLGFANHDEGSHNNLVISARDAFNWHTVPTGSMMVCCKRDTDHASASVAGCRTVWEYSVLANNADDGHTCAFPSAMTMIRAVAEMLHIEGWENYTLADGADASSVLDAEARSRTAYGKKHLGAQAIAKKSYKANTIRIERAGEEVLYVPISKNTQASISVAVTCGLDGGATYPQIVLEGPFLSTQTATASTTSQTLTVTVAASEPTQNALCRLVLKARETSTNAWAEFTQVQVTT